MLRSSMGFHTMTLAKALTSDSYRQIMKDFKKYSSDTGLIHIFRKSEKFSDIDNLSYIAIQFFDRDMGIKWLIKPGRGTANYHNPYIIYATVNPKILAGIPDYITASTYNDLSLAIKNFNFISSTISSWLGDFYSYDITRLDYCVNFDISELVKDCSPEQIMKLIKKSNIPSTYIEWTTYDPVSHRTKTMPGSFYIYNHSITINCYSKYLKLLEQSKENAKKGYPEIPQSTLNAARNIIRFEVQCKYHKMFDIRKKFENRQVDKDTFFSDTFCSEIIQQYFNKTIGKGNWYTLHEARNIILSMGFNKQKTKRLTDALELVNRCRSIPKAKDSVYGKECLKFEKSLLDLSNLGINPVTIPANWNIETIPNPLCIYYDKAERDKEIERARKNIMEESPTAYIHYPPEI